MQRRSFLFGASVLGLTAASAAFSQGRPAGGPPRMRKHTATSAKAVSLNKAGSSAGRAQVSISIKGGKRIITSNGIPSHRVGSFPNAGNPNAIRAQSYRFTMPLTPKSGSGSARGLGLTGVAVNGVPFDPGAAEFWQGNRNSGWQYEALGGAVTLGLDANYAHVQPTGAYHYHGLPIGLMQQLGWSASAASPLIGWASDGYPIYAITAASNGAVREMRSSYKLRSGNRPGGSSPSGKYDGAFVQDYAYVAGSGDLDEHNGATVRTAEYPNGTYAYFLTKSFPVIPRSLKGAPDASFNKGRG
ncbi:MAG: YHYH protein [Paracoccaceae bacterium]